MIRSRFKKGMDPKALSLSSSLSHDASIFEYDILTNAAHTLTLLNSSYLNREEAKEIIEALSKIRKAGFREIEDYEDVEEMIEAEVTKITAAGKKMHTGKSRNDEVATCLRMFARDALLKIASKLCELRKSLLEVSEANSDVIMPGFTHLQHAQPTKLSHHLLAYHEMIKRDYDRVIEAFKRVNLSPLGSAAFASTVYKLDRNYSANLLGFDGVVEHSEDGVASRDFLIESIFVCAQIMLDLSRICEEIVVFSNNNFAYVDLPEEFASTSSIMPQKKNPDIAELIRANAGRVIGNLTGAMAIYKATPFSYNRDFQELNALLYDSMFRTELACDVMASMIPKIVFNREKMREDASKGFSFATHLADHLVLNYSIPFRDAHKIVGKLVSDEISAKRLKEVAREFGYDIEMSEEELEKLKDVELIVESRKNIGGTAKDEIVRLITKRKEELKLDIRRVEMLKERIEMKIAKLLELIKDMGVEF